MTRFVVDASVALKWFIPEPHSDAAIRLLSDDHEILVPELFWAETGNVVWKKVRRKELSSKEGLDVLDALSRVPLETHADRPLLRAAFDLAVALDRTVYDSLYLALAIGRSCRLVTADRRLARALERTAVGPNILWVGETP